MASTQSGFNWTKQRLEAAQLVAEDALTDAEIAARVGISARQLYDWKKRPEFVARVDEIVRKLEAAIFSRGAARQARRVERYLNRLDAFDRVAQERGTSPEMADVRGGGTGFVTRSLRSVRHTHEKDPDDPEARATTVSVEVWEEAFDTGLAREIRELEKQLAQDLGQWSEKREISGPDGGPFAFADAVDLAALTDDELAALKSAMAKLAAPKEP